MSVAVTSFVGSCVMSSSRWPQLQYPLMSQSITTNYSSRIKLQALGVATSTAKWWVNIFSDECATGSTVMRQIVTSRNHTGCQIFPIRGTLPLTSAFSLESEARQWTRISHMEEGRRSISWWPTPPQTLLLYTHLLVESPRSAAETRDSVEARPTLPTGAFDLRNSTSM